MTTGLWVALMTGIAVGTLLGPAVIARTIGSAQNVKRKSKRAGRKMWNWGAAAAIVTLVVMVANARNGAA